MRVPLHTGPRHNQSIDVDETNPPKKLRFPFARTPSFDGDTEITLMFEEYGLQSFRGAGRTNYGYIFLGYSEPQVVYLQQNVASVTVELGTEELIGLLTVHNEEDGDIVPSKGGRPPKNRSSDTNQLATETVGVAVAEGGI